MFVLKGVLRAETEEQILIYLLLCDNSSLVQAVTMMLKHQFRPTDMKAFACARALKHDLIC